MHLAVVQTNPSLGAIQKNIARATTLLADLPQSQLDLIVLPELALTGYNFQTPSHITPYVETRTTSPSRKWAQKIAMQYNSSVVVGLPTQDEQRHNTAVFVDSTGKIVHEYHKYHMFETDYNWGCTSGSGFSFTNLCFDARHVRTSVGICMDLNPWEFIAPFSCYEFANYILANDVSLVIIPMAWLLSAEQESESVEPSLATFNYWIKRFEPLVHDAKTRTVVICNRTGEEEGAVYAGTSCVLQVGGGNVITLGMMGREEGVLSVEVALSETNAVTDNF
jgi:protein N-terminal amidase